MCHYIVEGGKELQDFPAFIFKHKKSMCITGTHTQTIYTTRPKVHCLM